MLYPEKYCDFYHLTSIERKRKVGSFSRLSALRRDRTHPCVHERESVSVLQSEIRNPKSEIE
jgi:hypothetical protein